MLNAFCRRAPAVRFIDFTTVFIGDLFLEWSRSSRSSPLDHGRRVARFFAFFAIALSLFAAILI
jgi:hypothetical protein